MSLGRVWMEKRVIIQSTQCACVGGWFGRYPLCHRAQHINLMGLCFWVGECGMSPGPVLLHRAAGLRPAKHAVIHSTSRCNMRRWLPGLAATHSATMPSANSSLGCVSLVSEWMEHGR